MNQQASKLFRAATAAAKELKDRRAIPRLLKLRREFPTANQRRKGQIRTWLRGLVARHRSVKLKELQPTPS